MKADNVITKPEEVRNPPVKHKPNPKNSKVDYQRDMPEGFVFNGKVYPYSPKPDHVENRLV